MTSVSNSGSVPDANAGNEIQQSIDRNQGQAIGQMIGGVAIGQLMVYLSQMPTKTETPALTVGQNPYQGLLAFRETDGDRFFGRSKQIEELWQRFQQLHNDPATVRILPIYGPSGSGKSSLARAGLIPALGRRPLPGRERGQVVVLTPGDRPLEALATVLARIATKDPMPVAKTREFKEELLQPNSRGEFDGLRRIADVFPDVSLAPPIVLVDQFEEIYTLCTDAGERHAFVENLLCAASDRAQRVSIILTMRSDFLGATQQHPCLNKLFSCQGFLVPIMQPEELETAIAEPAKRAGHPLDKATVQLLVQETQGQEGALPLLQFALTQIWEGLRQGVEPADTLQQIGGVGGALAGKAQELYESLSPERQQVARCIFLALVQLNEDNKSTRRRVAISELIASDRSEAIVREVIDCFARPGVWILVTSCNKENVEMLEVAHEALIRNWSKLQDWLTENWVAIREKRRIEQAAKLWSDRQKSKDYLLQGRLLRDAREFMQAHRNNSETALCDLAREFIQASCVKKNKTRLASAGFLIIPVLVTLIPLHFWLINKARFVLYNEETCKSNPETKFLIEYMVRLGYKNQLRGADLCSETLTDAYLKEANLSEGNLRNSNLAGANLRGASLEDADLSGAYLASTDLTYAFLQGTNLQDTELAGANLTGATLVGNRLEDTNLRGANLRESTLYRVDFSNSDLSEADLTEATIKEAINLSEEHIAQAKLCRTVLPIGIKVDNPNRDCQSSKP